MLYKYLIMIQPSLLTNLLIYLTVYSKFDINYKETRRHERVHLLSEFKAKLGTLKPVNQVIKNN